MNITRKQIAAGLRTLGLADGDIVLLHSSLASLGQVEGGAKSAVEAFLDVLGPEGTLVVPAFGALGVIPEAVKEDPRAVRSVHPLAGVAAIGAKASELCRDHWHAQTAHGPDTPYTRIANLGGYVCLLGVDQDRSTTLHTVEAMLELPYLRDRPTEFETEDGETVSKTWPLFPGPHRDFIGLDWHLRQSGAMNMGRIGNAVVRLIRSRDLIDICYEIGQTDPAFVLCDNPNCPDCRWQRGKVRQGRFAEESFRLVAAASLAGRYVPEIIENLQESGIDAIELDAIQGRPVQIIPTDKLVRYVEDLREAGVNVTALRSNGIGAMNIELLDKAGQVKVGRVVTPIHADAEELVRTAATKSVEISLYNSGVSSVQASDILLDLQAKGLQVGFTFNAAGFAVIGEKPFPESYKQKLRRFVDQLDIADATYDGSETSLAGGNAEIKEMISILRCASFAGDFTLGAGNRFAGTLLETAQAFETMLEQI